MQLWWSSCNIIREGFLPLFLRKEKKLKILLKLLFFEVKDILTESTRKRKNWFRAQLQNPFVARLCPWSIKLQRLYVQTQTLSLPDPCITHLASADGYNVNNLSCPVLCATKSMYAFNIFIITQFLIETSSTTLFLLLLTFVCEFSNLL